MTMVLMMMMNSPQMLITLSYKSISKLTHGTVLKVTKSGRVADQWRGATLEVALRMNAGSCSDIIDRNGT